MSDENALNEAAERLGPFPLPEPIASYEDDADPAVRGPWQIENANSADWALQRLAECEAEASVIDAQVKAAIERIRQRGEELKAKATRGGGFFRFKLLEYAERHRRDLLGGGKKKSRDFLHGRIGWRRKGGRLRVVDADALEPWLMAQGIESGLFRLRVEPDLKALQRLFTECGAVPPGTEFEPERDDIYVDASAPEAGLVKP